MAAAPRAGSALRLPPIPAHVVGNAFVMQYYHCLHTSPDKVYNFYHGNSRVARPSGSSRRMHCVTTLKEIKKKIKAMGKVVCVDVDMVESKASESQDGGIAILARGHVTLLRRQPRAFSQHFLLAPQQGGYFVLEDTFSYVDDAGVAPAAVGNSNDAKLASIQGGPTGLGLRGLDGHCGQEQEEAGSGIQGDGAEEEEEIIVYQGRQAP